MGFTDDDLLFALDELNKFHYSKKPPLQFLAVHLVFPKFSKYGIKENAKAVHLKANIFDRTTKNGVRIKKYPDLTPLQELRGLVTAAEGIREQFEKFLEKHRLSIDPKKTPEELFIIPLISYTNQIYDLCILEDRDLREIEFEKKYLAYFHFMVENYPKLKIRRKNFLNRMALFTLREIFFVSETDFGLEGAFPLKSKNIDFALLSIFTLARDLDNKYLDVIAFNNYLSFFKFLPQLSGMLNTRGEIDSKHRLIAPRLVQLGLLLTAIDADLSNLGMSTLAAIYGVEHDTN